MRVVRPHETVAALLEGTTTVLARAGRWIPQALRHEGVRQTDMEAALRRQNAYKVDDVDEVKLEPGGTIVVDLRPELESARPRPTSSGSRPSSTGCWPAELPGTSYGTEPVEGSLSV